VALAIVSGATVISAVGHMLYAVPFSTERVVAVYARARRGIFRLGLECSSASS